MKAHQKHKTKKEVFILRLSQEDKTRLQDKAKEQNLSMSSYVRTNLLKNSKDDSKKD